MRHASRWLITAALLAVPMAARAAPPPTPLQDTPTGANDLRLGYFPVPVDLSNRKPAGIVKEPAYRVAPKYGVIHLGNGPASRYVIALDEPANADWKIYLDANRNGDLTDDGDGAWTKKDLRGGRTMYGVNKYVLRASYGTSTHETGSVRYGLSFYRFADLKPLLMYRNGARTGTIALAGKSHRIALVENDADALFNKPIGDDGKPLNGKSTRPLWLVVLPDNGEASARPMILDARAPFSLDGKVYEARIPADGSSLALVPTRRVAYAPKEPAPPPLLAKGTMAPDFTADTPDGGKLKLSDYRGKVVVLDFWATWCGPCQASMPHIQRVYQRVKDQNVAVVGVCVWDARDAFKQWLPAHKDQYSFTFAFDPAERDTDKSISSKLYKVSGIPTTYVIDKEGNVVDAIVGYDDGDHRLEDTLKKVGINALG